MTTENRPSRLHESDSYDIKRMQSLPLPIALYHGLLDGTRAECLIALVVVRSTLGWRANGAPGHRRAQACLSHQDLKQRTGIKSSTTVSKSIDALVRRGLLETLDRGGMLLVSPQDRRRYHRPITFRIPRWIAERQLPEDK